MAAVQMREKELIHVTSCGIESCKPLQDEHGNGILLASRDCKVHLVRIAEDLASGSSRVVKSYEGGHAKRVRDVEYSAAGNKIISVADDNTLIIRERDGAIEIKQKGHSRSITSVALNSDNTKIVTGSEDGSFIVWNSQGNQVFVFDKSFENGHLGWINACGFVPGSSDTLLTASEDGTVKIWDLESCTLTKTIFKGEYIDHERAKQSNDIQKFCDFNAAVKALAFAKKGSLAAYGGRDAKVYLMQLKHEELLQEITVDDRVTALAFGENQPLLAIAIPNTILLWNILEQKIVGRYEFATSGERYCYSLTFIGDEVFAALYNGTLVRIEIVRSN